jgi:hypothetical protein
MVKIRKLWPIVLGAVSIPVLIFAAPLAGLAFTTTTASYIGGGVAALGYTGKGILKLRKNNRQRDFENIDQTNNELLTQIDQNINEETKQDVMTTQTLRSVLNSPEIQNSPEAVHELINALNAQEQGSKTRATIKNLIIGYTSAFKVKDLKSSKKHLEVLKATLAKVNEIDRQVLKHEKNVEKIINQQVKNQALEENREEAVVLAAELEKVRTIRKIDGIKRSNARREVITDTITNTITAINHGLNATVEILGGIRSGVQNAFTRKKAAPRLKKVEDGNPSKKRAA